MIRREYMTVMVTIAMGIAFAQSTWTLAQAELDEASRANLEAAVRRVIGIEKPKVASFDDPQGKCISVPSYPEPDARSTSSKPFAWYMEFFDKPELPPQRTRQLQQLNALAHAGLLSKKIIEPPEVQERGVRYGVTENGWAAMSGTTTMDHPQYCFAYGRVQVLGVTRADRQNLRSDDPFELYTVHAKVGFRSEAELAPWARDNDVQAAFPEIHRVLEGEDMTELFVRDGEDWVPYYSMVRLEQELLRERQTPQDGAKPRRRDPQVTAKDDVGTLKKLSGPTEKEIKDEISKHHGVHPQHPLTQWPIPCVHLPGSEKLPVDKSLMADPLGPYAVAIFTNKPRTPHDRIAQKTIPYLDQLERLGIFAKRAVTGLDGEGKDSNKSYDGYIYELVPQYQAMVHSRYHCFHLGLPTVKVVTLKIGNQEEHPLSTFAYRIKVLYTDPPEWANDPVLKNWPEFRSALDNGFACEGSFEFDRKSRDQVGGTGGCWWAFDSYYEFH